MSAASFRPERNPTIPAQKEAVHSLQYVPPLSILASLIAAVCVVPFAYLALAKAVPSQENPNPPTMDPLSQWMSIFFHAALFYHVGGAEFTWFSELWRTRKEHHFARAYRTMAKDPTRLTILKQLIRSVGFLIGCYLSSLFALMPTISLVRAAQFAETPTFFLNWFYVVQSIFLFMEVRAFSARIFSFLKDRFQQDATRIARSADFNMTERVIDWVLTRSANQKQYHTLLLKLILGGPWRRTDGTSRLLPGLMEDHIPDSTDPQKGLRHPYGLREHYLRSHEEEGEGVYADWGAVRKAVQALDAEIQEQERLVRSPLAWRIFLLSFQWFLRIFTFILCSLYVTPQAILAGDALNNSLPGGLVGYINWLGLRSTTAGVLFNLGLTCFFWNFITAFFEKVMAKHLRMIAADFKEIGFGWEWKRYVKALFNQHILMWFSLLIGVLAIPPFMYIFQVGSRAIDAADDLEGPAQWMCALLKWLKPTHFLIVYYNAFLVASTCQSLFERLVNYGRAKMEGDPAANLKQMILKWLESFKEVTQKETIQMPLHKMGMKDATPIYYASVYYASQVFVEEKKMPQQHPFEPLWA